MAFLSSKQGTAIALAFSLFAGTFLTGFTTQAGIGNVYYETKTEIFDNTYYYEQFAGHSTNGIERAYYIEADTKDAELEPYVFEGDVTGMYSMNTMIATLENQGYHVIAGVNGDLYDTASGTPKGLSIHDGIISTSGYAPEYVMSFTEEGEASLEKVNLSYTLKGTINVPTYVTTTSAAVQTTTSAVTEGSITTDATVETQQALVYVPTDYTAPIGFFNVPHGGAKALHLFNRQYATSTKTAETSVEVVLNVNTAAETKLKVGGTITATVAQVINGNFNTPIGENQLVLSAAWDSPYAVPISQLSPGSTVELSVTDNGGNLSDSDEAVGVYYVLYQNGQYVTNGTNLNPRTIMGIKADGTLVVYSLDGRQSGYSSGLGLTDTAKHLVALGCTTVVNMDGGGSTVMAVREGGADKTAVQKNSPSDGYQRKTTNGFFLVYKGSGSSTPAHLHTYASQPLAMPGAQIQLSTYASNENYEPTSLKKSVSYDISSDDETGSSVNSSGVLLAGNKIGTVCVEAESGGINTSIAVDIQNNITFTTNTQNLVIDPGKTSDINVTAYFGYSPIASMDSLYQWSCDGVIGTIDANGLFQATSESGVSGNIYVSYNGVTKTIPVQVGASSVDFQDTKEHWARDYIGKLAARGIVNGMGDNYYMPDDSLTRAQFLTMLAKTVYGLDTSQSTATGFTDVPDYEWFYNYVNWGYENGIVKGIDEVTFAPNNNITREQMAIMLSNFTRSTGIVLPETTANTSFTDSNFISEWANESVNKIVLAGIMGGYPEGDFIPQGNATRAEAAAVIYKYISIRDNIAKK